MADNFTIARIQESFRIDDAGETTQVKQVLYRVGKDGPFSVEIPTAEFDPEKVRELLTKESQKIIALRGEV